MGHPNEDLIRQGYDAFSRGDFRWVAEVVNHLVFADPDNMEAKRLQAQALEQLAYGAENGTWRNFFLMGAHELRHGSAGTAATIPPDFIVNLSTEQLFDSLIVATAAHKAGFDTSRAFHFHPFTPNLPTQLGAFHGFNG